MVLSDEGAPQCWIWASLFRVDTDGLPSSFLSSHKTNEQRPGKQRNSTFRALESSYAALAFPSLKSKLPSGDCWWNQTGRWVQGQDCTLTLDMHKSVHARL